YALIGDCHGAGLVAKTGSMDWLCVPRFDSPACFAALLGTSENGRWLIAPAARVTRTERRYRGDTLVLETVFHTDEGIVALIDCMPPNSRAVDVVRIVHCLSGRVRMNMELVVRFDYGSVVPWVTRENHSLTAIAGPDMLHLHTPVAHHGEGLRTVADFEVSEGERIPFVMTFHPSHLPPPIPTDAEHAVQATESFWREWSSQSSYKGPYREAVQRSLIALKALTYKPTGGIAAAPTTSLPERIGGQRNWDYRFCWVRDASITLYSLLAAGYTNEARAWREWLLRAVAGSPGQIQALYGIAGERVLREWEVPWLSGYEGSVPVRVGNGAHEQLQLDVFGELMDAMHECRRLGLENAHSWRLERSLLVFLEDHWREPDSGIWEVRGPRRHFTHSKVMAWVAFDRGIKAIEQFGHEGPLERWREIRQAIHDDVCSHAFSEAKQAFTQFYGSTLLDAAVLQIPLVGFLPISDPRVQSTIAAIERELVVDGCFVRRYQTESGVDGFTEGEGAFLACSFWLVDNLVMLGRREEAERLFDRLLALRNDVGLLSEEYDPHERRMVGNFPQAFSHLALVDAAYALAHAAKNPEQHRLAPERARASR
ncbi:MAG TPA: glycoside hydrolase family 15 protein, partial [Polyangiaceae bacterium]